MSFHETKECCCCCRSRDLRRASAATSDPQEEVSVYGGFGANCWGSSGTTVPTFQSTSFVPGPMKLFKVICLSLSIRSELDVGVVTCVTEGKWRIPIQRFLPFFKAHSALRHHSRTDGDPAFLTWHQKQ